MNEVHSHLERDWPIIIHSLPKNYTLKHPPYAKAGVQKLSRGSAPTGRVKREHRGGVTSSFVSSSGEGNIKKYYSY